ncbi:MAG: peptidylprolyl isomerase [Candidatus Moranbacteria bacterium]|nr:peptidylprolyl isomerase [Candidatus Moranbacteria bacterium]MDD3965035.1 peptidylprolyl isomerase [Candidatus Moranbacteria bacterium]
MSNTTHNFSRKIRLSTVLYTIAVVVLSIFLLSLIAVYTSFGSVQSTTALKSVLPYPIVVIGYDPVITSRALARNMVSVKRFYEVQNFSEIGVRVDFSTPDGQKRFKIREKEVLNKMIEDRAIEVLAKEKDIRVSHDEASQSVSRKLSEYNSEVGVKNELERLYGWTIADFEEKVVMPSLYQEKLEKSLEEVFRDDTSKAQEKILNAQKSIRLGNTFEEVVKQYSDGAGQENGGDIGWFTSDDILPALRTVMNSQKVGIPGDVVESPLGFHIVLIEEIKTENEQNLYHLKQVFIQKKTFSDFLSEKMRMMSIFVLSPEYVWDKETARAEFTDESIRDFEKKMYENADNNTAFFF